MTTPGDIKTVPFDKLFYNARFDDYKKVKVVLTNLGVRRIGFRLKFVGDHQYTIGPNRIEIDPANGCLDAGNRWRIDDKSQVVLTNMGVRRIGYRVYMVGNHLYPVGPNRIEIDRANGCLDAGEHTVLWVTLGPFGGFCRCLLRDRVAIEWTDAPAGAPKKYNRDWFTGTAIVRRKNVTMQYNR